MSLVKTSRTTITLLVFVFYICTSLETTYADQLLIQRICDKTTNSTECMRYMTADPRLVGATNIYEIAQCVIYSSRILAQKALRQLTILIDQSPPSSKEALEVCMAQYEFMREKTKLVYEHVADKKKIVMSEVRMCAMSMEHAVNLCLTSIGLSYPSVTMFNIGIRTLYEILLIISSEKQH